MFVNVLYQFFGGVKDKSLNFSKLPKSKKLYTLNAFKTDKRAVEL